MSNTGFYFLTTAKLYKKTEIKRLKNFPAGYVGSFYKKLADNVDNFLVSDFYGRINNDADIHSEDVQKYILATSDFAKGIQTDIEHYVSRDCINNVRFRQKLDLISKNILRRQNPLELVFQDVSTFDAENPIVGSLFRELDLKKKGSDSDFIKNLPCQPGKNFEIKKRLDRLRGVTRFPKESSNNNKFPTPVRPFSPPLIDPSPWPPGSGPAGFNPFQPPPPSDPFTSRGRFNPSPLQAPSFNNFGNLNFGAQPSNLNKPNVGNETALVLKQLPWQNKKKIYPTDDVRLQIDDTIYELTEQSDLEIGNGLIDTLGVEANDLLDSDFVTAQEDIDAVWEQIKEDYNFDETKETFDQGDESVEFFYGGDNDNIFQNGEFLNPNSDNGKFVPFLLSDLGRNVMTSNRLSIHNVNGDIFYENHNTGNSFYIFLMDQQNQKCGIHSKKMCL